MALLGTSDNSIQTEQNAQLDDHNMSEETKSNEQTLKNGQSFGKSIQKVNFSHKKQINGK